jgi:hypothetical protein
MAYVVQITEAAAATNTRVAAYREEVGERVRFDSAADAERLVAKLNDEGDGEVHLRHVHEDHPLEEQDVVDGYVEPA